MSNTTNIFDLPVDPAGGSGAQSNVSMAVNEVSTQLPPSQSQPLQPLPPQPNQFSQQPPTQSQNDSNLTLDQDTINSIVSGIQQASSSGVTQLPSRDIPTNTNHLSQDPAIQPNYIPPATQGSYIEDDENEDDIIANYNKQNAQYNSLDSMYDELQTPLLLAVLFFLFQLPFFKKYLFAYLPMFFLNDGNYNIYGFIFMSMLFAFVYYLTNKTMNSFNTF